MTIQAMILVMSTLTWVGFTVVVGRNTDRRPPRAMHLRRRPAPSEVRDYSRFAKVTRAIASASSSGEGRVR